MKTVTVIGTENDDTHFAMKGEMFKVMGTIYEPYYKQELPFIKIHTEYFAFLPEDLKEHVLAIKEEDIIYYFLLDTVRELQTYQLKNKEAPWTADY